MMRYEFLEAGSRIGWNCFNGWNGSTGMMGWIGGGIALFFGLILVIVLIYALISWSRNARTQSFPPGYTNPISPANDSLKILNERYARGEIGDDDYRRIKNELLK